MSAASSTAPKPTPPHQPNPRAAHGLAQLLTLIYHALPRDSAYGNQEAPRHLQQPFLSHTQACAQKVAAVELSKCQGAALIGTQRGPAQPQNGDQNYPTAASLFRVFVRSGSDTSPDAEQKLDKRVILIPIAAGHDAEFFSSASGSGTSTRSRPIRDDYHCSLNLNPQYSTAETKLTSNGAEDYLTKPEAFRTLRLEIEQAVIKNNQYLHQVHSRAIPSGAETVLTQLDPALTEDIYAIWKENAQQEYSHNRLSTVVTSDDPRLLEADPMLENIERLVEKYNATVGVKGLPNPGATQRTCLFSAARYTPKTPQSSIDNSGLAEKVEERKVLAELQYTSEVPVLTTRGNAFYSYWPINNQPHLTSSLIGFAETKRMFKTKDGTLQRSYALGISVPYTNNTYNRFARRGKQELSLSSALSDCVWTIIRALPDIFRIVQTSHATAGVDFGAIYASSGSQESLEAGLTSLCNDLQHCITAAMVRVDQLPAHDETVVNRMDESKTSRRPTLAIDHVTPIALWVPGTSCITDPVQRLGTINTGTDATFTTVDESKIGNAGLRVIKGSEQRELDWGVRYNVLLPVGATLTAFIARHEKALVSVANYCELLMLDVEAYIKQTRLSLDVLFNHGSADTRADAMEEELDPAKVAAGLSSSIAHHAKMSSELARTAGKSSSRTERLGSWRTQRTALNDLLQSSYPRLTIPLTPRDALNAEQVRDVRSIQWRIEDHERHVRYVEATTGAMAAKIQASTTQIQVQLEDQRKQVVGELARIVRDHEGWTMKLAENESKLKEALEAFDRAKRSREEADREREADIVNLKQQLEGAIKTANDRLVAVIQGQMSLIQDAGAARSYKDDPLKQQVMALQESNAEMKDKLDTLVRQGVVIMANYKDIKSRILENRAVEAEVVAVSQPNTPAVATVTPSAPTLPTPPQVRTSLPASRPPPPPLQSVESRPPSAPRPLTPPIPLRFDSTESDRDVVTVVNVQEIISQSARAPAATSTVPATTSTATTASTASLIRRDQEEPKEKGDEGGGDIDESSEDESIDKMEADGDEMEEDSADENPRAGPTESMTYDSDVKDSPPKDSFVDYLGFKVVNGDLQAAHDQFIVHPNLINAYLNALVMMMSENAKGLVTIFPIDLIQNIVLARSAAIKNVQEVNRETGQSPSLKTVGLYLSEAGRAGKLIFEPPATNSDRRKTLTSIIKLFQTVEDLQLFQKPGFVLFPFAKTDPLGTKYIYDLIVVRTTKNATGARTLTYRIHHIQSGKEGNWALVGDKKADPKNLITSLSHIVSVSKQLREIYDAYLAKLGKATGLPFTHKDFLGAYDSFHSQSAVTSPSKYKVDIPLDPQPIGINTQFIAVDQGRTSNSFMESADIAATEWAALQSIPILLAFARRFIQDASKSIAVEISLKSEVDGLKERIEEFREDRKERLSDPEYNPGESLADDFVETLQYILDAQEKQLAKEQKEFERKQLAKKGIALKPYGETVDLFAVSDGAVFRFRDYSITQARLDDFKNDPASSVIAFSVYHRLYFDYIINRMPLNVARTREKGSPTEFCLLPTFIRENREEVTDELMISKHLSGVPELPDYNITGKPLRYAFLPVRRDLFIENGTNKPKYSVRFDLIVFCSAVSGPPKDKKPAPAKPVAGDAAAAAAPVPEVSAEQKAEEARAKRREARKRKRTVNIVSNTHAIIFTSTGGGGVVGGDKTGHGLSDLADEYYRKVLFPNLTTDLKEAPAHIPKVTIVPKADITDEGTFLYTAIQMRYLMYNKIKLKPAKIAKEKPEAAGEPKAGEATATAATTTTTTTTTATTTTTTTTTTKKTKAKRTAKKKKAGEQVADTDTANKAKDVFNLDTPKATLTFDRGSAFDKAKQEMFAQCFYADFAGYLPQRTEAARFKLYYQEGSHGKSSDSFENRERALQVLRTNKYKAAPKPEKKKKDPSQKKAKKQKAIVVPLPELDDNQLERAINENLRFKVSAKTYREMSPTAPYFDSSVIAQTAERLYVEGIKKDALRIASVAAAQERAYLEAARNLSTLAPPNSNPVHYLPQGPIPDAQPVSQDKDERLQFGLLLLKGDDVKELIQLSREHDAGGDGSVDIIRTKEAVIFERMFRDANGKYQQPSEYKFVVFTFNGLITAADTADPIVLAADPPFSMNWLVVVQYTNTEINIAIVDPTLSPEDGAWYNSARLDKDKPRVYYAGLPNPSNHEATTHSIPSRHRAWAANALAVLQRASEFLQPDPEDLGTLPPAYESPSSIINASAGSEAAQFAAITDESVDRFLPRTVEIFYLSETVRAELAKTKAVKTVAKLSGSLSAYSPDNSSYNMLLSFDNILPVTAALGNKLSLPVGQRLPSPQQWHNDLLKCIWPSYEKFADVSSAGRKLYASYSVKVRLAREDLKDTLPPPPPPQQQPPPPAEPAASVTEEVVDQPPPPKVSDWEFADPSAKAAELFAVKQFERAERKKKGDPVVDGDTEEKNEGEEDDDDEVAPPPPKSVKKAGAKKAGAKKGGAKKTGRGKASAVAKQKAVGSESSESSGDESSDESSSSSSSGGSDNGDMRIEILA